jgi:hypothetical protein
LRENLQKNEVDQHIIQIVKEEKPETVEQLVKLTQNKFPLPKQEILNRILDLQKKGKIRLKPRENQTPETLRHYLRSTQPSWYWITIILASTIALLTFTIPENAFPLVYARYILGSILVLWLPGYTSIKALFPTKLPIQTNSQDLEKIERTALSIGMSLALVPITGLLLNYTPWGIRLTPITLSLLTLTTTFATAAIIREHQTQTIPKV